MPTVSVCRDELFRRLEGQFDDESFDELCFKFGLELDDIIVEKDDSGVSKTTFKIDVPANRYDLLCVEGISLALNVYLGRISYPEFSFFLPEIPITVVMDKNLGAVRPFLSVAVIRDVVLTKEVLNSIIDVQEKLHFNIGRRRKLVSIGVHDLDAVSSPFKYSLVKKEDISFQSLISDTVQTADDMFTSFGKTHLKEYLSLLSGETRYPLLVDCNEEVLSLPPIINGIRTKVTTATKNIFIDVTGTDSLRVETSLLVICTMISQHSNKKYSIEQCRIEQEDNPRLTPVCIERKYTVQREWLNRRIGIECSTEEYIKLLNSMCLKAQRSTDGAIDVVVTPTRQDILHCCDIMEDAAIAYGFNNIPKVYPNISTVSTSLYLNRFCEKIRQVVAQSSFTEIVSFVVSSLDDLTLRMNKKNEHGDIVSLETGHDLNCVRSSLLPGMLKALAANKSQPLPIKIFEVGDVVKKTKDSDPLNKRHLCILNMGKQSGFEVVQGVLDRVMQYTRIPFTCSSKDGYWLEPFESEKSMLQKRCARIHLKDKEIGIIGITHPNVLKAFELNMPCSSVEIDLEILLSSQT